MERVQAKYCGYSADMLAVDCGVGVSDIRREIHDERRSGLDRMIPLYFV